jgi:hypothetical protein
MRDEVPYWTKLKDYRASAIHVLRRIVQIETNNHSLCVVLYIVSFKRLKLRVNFCQLLLILLVQ